MIGKVWTPSGWKTFGQGGGGGGAVPALVSVHDVGNAAGAVNATTTAAHDWSPWGEVIAATTEETTWLEVLWAGGVAINRQTMVEVGVGLAGDEAPLAASSAFYRSGNSNTHRRLISIPTAAIPAGSRIAVRMMVDSASVSQGRISVVAGRSSTPTAGPVSVYGIDPESSIVDFSVTANGSWVEVGAAPTGLVGVHITAVSAAQAADTLLIEVGVGSSGSEQAVGAAMQGRGGRRDAAIESPQFIPTEINSGERVSIRITQDSGDFSTYGVVLHMIGAAT